MLQKAKVWAHRHFRTIFPHRTEDVAEMAALCAKYKGVALSAASTVREVITDPGEDTIHSILFFYAEVRGVAKTGERIIFAREVQRTHFVTHWAGGDVQLFNRLKGEAEKEANACLAQVQTIIASKATSS